MNIGRGRSLAVMAVLGAFLIVPTSGHAVVTIGSNLGRAPDPNFVLGGAPLTAAHNPLPPGIAAPGGTTSSVNGIVTVWRLRVGPKASTTSLKVLRPTGGNFYQGISNSTQQNPLPNAINTFVTAQAIQRGDEIGVDCCLNTSSYIVQNPANLTKFWNPPLVNGGTPLPPTDPGIPFELALNADIEPTSAFTIQQVQRLKKGRLRVTVDLPNPGTVVAGDPRDKQTGASAASKKKKKKKKKPQLLRRTTATATVPATLTLVVKATKAALKRLKAKALRTGKKKVKIGAALRISFTPTGGSAAVETEKTKLKR